MARTRIDNLGMWDDALRFQRLVSGRGGE